MQILYDAGFELPADDGAILAHASCDFLRPLTYPATVRVTHKVTPVSYTHLDVYKRQINNRITDWRQDHVECY